MTAEQQARDMLCRMGIDAESFTAGDVVELANLIAEVEALRADAERWRWCRQNAITLDDFAYYIDNDVEAFVDAARKA